MDALGILRVQLGKLRPVHPRLEVVHRVVAVVEEESVEDRPDEVAGVVPLAVRVGLDVLQEIDALDREERHLLGITKKSSALRQSSTNKSAMVPKKTTYSEAAARNAGRSRFQRSLRKALMSRVCAKLVSVG